MTTDIATTEPRMPVQTMHDAITLATAFAQAGVMGAKNPPEGMLAVTLINEIGLVRAEARYHIMMGRLSKKAEAILGDFIKKGGKYKIVHRDAECAEVIASMGETIDAQFRFSWEDALQEPFIYAGKPPDQRAQLKKPVAERKLKDKYSTPRSRMQMLWARLVSDMGRALCPDACEGLYPPEEVADFEEVNENAGKVIDVEEVQRRTENITQQYTTGLDVCPIGDASVKGKRWADLSSDILRYALPMDSVNESYKAVIRQELQKRGEQV